MQFLTSVCTGYPRAYSACLPPGAVQSREKAAKEKCRRWRQ